MLSTDNSFEMFPRYNGVTTFSESFAFALIILLTLTNK